MMAWNAHHTITSGVVLFNGIKMLLALQLYNTHNWGKLAELVICSLDALAKCGFNGPEPVTKTPCVRECAASCYTSVPKCPIKRKYLTFGVNNNCLSVWVCLFAPSTLYFRTKCADVSPLLVRTAACLPCLCAVQINKQPNYTLHRRSSTRQMFNWIYSPLQCTRLNWL